MKRSEICSRMKMKFFELKWMEILPDSARVSGSSGPGSSPGRGHCVVFLGKTLYSHSASLHPDV